MVLVIEVGWIHVVATVPMHISQPTVISLILHDGLSRDSVPILVLVLPIAKLVGLFGALRAQGGLTQAVHCDWWSQVLEHHVLCTGHFYIYFF